MIGYCGINCLECNAYKATVAGDENGLERMIEKHGPTDGTTLDWVCLGCGPHNHSLLARYCDTCKVRVCATAQGVTSCAECDAFEGCSSLHEFLKTEPETLGRTMGWLRASYLARRGRTAPVSSRQAR